LLQELAALLEARDLGLSVHSIEHHVPGQEHGPPDERDEEVGGLGNELEVAVEMEQRVNVLYVGECYVMILCMIVQGKYDYYNWVGI
jgi:sugar phosphate isomerase/epimerase